MYNGSTFGPLLVVKKEFSVVDRRFFSRSEHLGPETQKERDKSYNVFGFTSIRFSERQERRLETLERERRWTSKGRTYERRDVKTSMTGGDVKERIRRRPGRPSTKGGRLSRGGPVTTSESTSSGEDPTVVSVIFNVDVETSRTLIKIDLQKYHGRREIEGV